MTKRSRKQSESVSYAKQWAWGIVGTLVTGLAFGGWAVRSYIEDELASKDDLIVVQAQVQTALDQQMEDVMARIANLEAKPKKSQYDYDQIKYLRDQLERLRRMRAIK